LKVIAALLLSCILATALAQSPDDEQPPAETPEQEETPGAEPEVDAAVPESPVNAEEETIDSAPAEDEFEPDEEISEDYPEPLPSDI
jgi:hypothetical protein